jgi:hypothetical protein
MIRNIQFFYSHKSTKQNSQQPSFASHIHKMLTSTSFPTVDHSSKCKLQKLPESTSFLTTKCSLKIRLLLRSSPSHVHLHLLGQVASVAECSNNQPSVLLIRTPHTYIHKNMIESIGFLPPKCSSKIR